MPEIRIQRTVFVHAEFTREFMKSALEVAEHSARVMGVESDVYYNPHREDSYADFRIFSDFQSMAQYEDLFLGKMLSDSRYLESAEKAVKMIVKEPFDALFVRLRPDDYFMNKGAGKRHDFAFEKAGPKPATKARYRREREYCASKGRLRDVMQITFEFMDRMYKATKTVPDYFCTRFHEESIGCSKLFLDLDNCPMCGPAFFEQDEELSRHSGLLTTPPINRLFTRVTSEDVNFNLKTAVG